MRAPQIKKFTRKINGQSLGQQFKGAKRYPVPMEREAGSGKQARAKRSATAERRGATERPQKRQKTRTEFLETAPPLCG